MRRASTVVYHLAVAVSLSLGFVAHGKKPPSHGDMDFEPPHPHPREFGELPQRIAFPFRFLDEPTRATAPPAAETRAVWLAGGSLAATNDGALVLDADSGELALLDAELQVKARLAIAHDASQLVFDPATKRAYVIDRKNDRVVVVTVDQGKLARSRTFATRPEPFGAALTPDAKTLLVTSVLDESAAAYDVATGKERWRVEVGAEPRGVAVSPDGTQALVASLRTGALARLDLRGAKPTVEFLPINPMPAGRSPTMPEIGRDNGRGFGRNAFAALYIGNDLGVVAHQESRPNLATGFQEVRSTYGGGFEPPVAHRLSFVAGDSVVQAEITAHQPRALAWDGQRDTLYLAAFGNDELVAIADASQRGARLGWSTTITTDGESCGPSGIAVGAGGDLLVFCELTRRVVRMRRAEGGEVTLAASSLLFESRYTDEELRGRALFRVGSSTTSAMGAAACTSCHPEGRTDGLSWRIEGHQLQTPILAGRIAGTHPFKWDGKDPTLADSLKGTIARLGGTGVSQPEIEELAAWIQRMPRPRAPSPSLDAKAVARGKKLFESEKTGCATCHGGATFSDGKSHDLAIDLEQVDTPSLIGLAVSAPYYHDGSAATLRAALTERGTVHGMGSTSSLSDKELADLIAYLETL